MAAKLERGCSVWVKKVRFTIIFLFMKSKGAKVA